MRGRQFSQTAPDFSEAVVRGFLQPMHVWVFLVNFIKPPRDGAATEMERVCSPVKSCADFFSPRIGSNIRPRGFASWLSR